jgi:hypothetical protein
MPKAPKSNSDTGAVETMKNMSAGVATKKTNLLIDWAATTSKRPNRFKQYPKARIANMGSMGSESDESMPPLCLRGAGGAMILSKYD